MKIIICCLVRSLHFMIFTEHDDDDDEEEEEKEEEESFSFFLGFLKYEKI
jgi:hypothetical protein